MRVIHFLSSFFFFNDTATTEIYTLSLHDALPISGRARSCTSDAASPPLASAIDSRSSPRRRLAVTAAHAPARSRRRQVQRCDRDVVHDLEAQRSAHFLGGLRGDHESPPPVPDLESHAAVVCATGHADATGAVLRGVGEDIPERLREAAPVEVRGCWAALPLERGLPRLRRRVGQ